MSQGILSACIPWCCCAWRRMEGRHRLIYSVGYSQRAICVG